MILTVVFVVLMVLWLFGECYINWDPAQPRGLGNTLLPWLCVAILGWLVLGGGVVVVAAR